MMINMIYKYNYVSPLGAITFASSGESLMGLWFDGQKYFPDDLYPRELKLSCRYSDKQQTGSILTSAVKFPISHR